MGAASEKTGDKGTHPGVTEMRMRRLKEPCYGLNVCVFLKFTC